MDSLMSFKQNLPALTKNHPLQNDYKKHQPSFIIHQLETKHRIDSKKRKSKWINFVCRNVIWQQKTVVS